MISKRDRDALSRCLQQIEADPQWRENFKARKARGDDWATRADAACSILQKRNLKLMPWEIPPCSSDPHPLDHHCPYFQQRKEQAKVFADRLRQHQLSIFEPHPIEALQAIAEARQRELHVIEPSGDAA